MKRYDEERIKRFKLAYPEESAKLSDNAILVVIRAMKVGKNEMNRWIKERIQSYQVR